MPIRREIVVTGIAGGEEDILSGEETRRLLKCSDRLILHGHLDALSQRLVKRFLSKLKHFRRVATRYDKLAENFHEYDLIERRGSSQANDCP